VRSWLAPRSHVLLSCVNFSVFTKFMTAGKPTAIRINKSQTCINGVHVRLLFIDLQRIVSMSLIHFAQLDF
jgi:hypothetical protein